MGKLKSLTLKQENFTAEFLRNGGNGCQAALKAYDTVDPNAARVIASENLDRPHIHEAIEKARSKLNPEYVLNKLLEKSLSMDPYVSLKATELLGKVLKMFTDRVDHTHVLETVQSIGWEEPKQKIEQKEEKATIA